ncbi:CBS domain-containing protein [Streptomyces sp. NPDC054796]
MLLGWKEIGDLGELGTRTNIKNAVATAYPTHSTFTRANWTGQLNRFYNDIAVGDLVVVPLPHARIAIGTIASGYEYRPDINEGFPHIRHVTWTVKNTERDRFQLDIQDSMGSLLTVFELRRFGAAERIAKVASGGTDPGRPDADPLTAGLDEPEKLFEAARSADKASPLTISVRDLLKVWDEQRREAAVISRVQEALTEQGLATVPHFTEGSLDSMVSLVPVASVVEDEQKASPEESVVEPVESDEIAYLVSNVESANAVPESVRAGDDLRTAVTLMTLKGYSQLPVLDGDGRLLGAVSWESISRAHLVDAGAGLSAATVPVREANRSDDLLDWIVEIQQTGYVFVRDDAHKVCGIVTAADLTGEFETRVRPFVLVEEIEQHLRRALDARIPLEDIRKRARMGSRVGSAADLSMGDYKHVLRDEKNWGALGWNIDKELFLVALDQCRVFRNQLMHFSPDPVTEQQLRPLRGLLDLLRSLRQPS